MRKSRKKRSYKVRRLIMVIGIILLISGLGLIGYPRFSQWRYTITVDNYIERYEENVNDEENQPAFDELYARLLAENKKLYEEGQKNLIDPFSYENPGIDLTAYGLMDNTIGYLVIPRMGQNLPIYLGASEANMKKGATHLTQTSYPIGGINTNTIIAAHRGYYKADMFRYINKMEVGDQIQIRNFRETLTYEVVEIEIIDPNQSEEILIQEGRDLVTLLSCHPYGYSRYRYLVRCERVAEISE